MSVERKTEYIDRKAAIEEIDKVLDRYYAADDDKAAEAGDDCRYAIEKTPAADVAPVVRGRWIFNDDWWEFRCTNCHKSIGNIEKYKYCPHCGARMDGGNA